MFFLNQLGFIKSQMRTIIKEMRRIIKSEIQAKNIIHNSFFNIAYKTTTPNTYHSIKSPLNNHLSHHKQISLQFHPSTKFHFSTNTKPSPTMQPQLKPKPQFQSQTQLQPQPQTKPEITHSESQNQDHILPPFEDQLFEQLLNHESTTQNSEQHKLKSQKRKQRLQQIRAQLKDPENRRQRNRQRHQKQKDKLQKHLIGLKEQEIKQYLTNRKKLKLQQKQQVKEAVQKQIGQPFLIDIAFAHVMNEKENKSLAIQIQLIVKALKQIQPPPNVHLCGLTQGITKAQLVSNKFEVWPIKSYEQPLEECLMMQKFKHKKMFYLSPDSTKTLDTIEPDSVFIIGGLVDRTVIKNASLNRARKLNIEARSLPIRQFMKQRSCLNLDHIVMILCKYMEVKDWKAAFEHGAPKRWKKGEGEQGLKELKSSDEDFSDD